MANFQGLRSIITSNVYENSRNEISGDRMQQVLLAMVDELGAGYTFKGTALPETDPGTPDYNVFYIAAPGTYPNFGGGFTIPAGCLGILEYNGSWSLYTVEVLPSQIETSQIADGAVTGDKLADLAVTTAKIVDAAVTEAKLASELITKLFNSGYKYAGVAILTTNPGTPTLNVFYVASTAGSYTNFSLVVDYGEIAIFKYNGSSWTKDSIFTSDFRQEANKAEFYIIDNNGYIIAKFSKEGGWTGLQTTALKVKYNGNMVDILDLISSHTTELDEIIKQDYSNTLYVSDNNGNVIAKIDNKGVETIGYLTKNSKFIDDGDGAFKIVDKNGYIGFKISGRSNVVSQVNEAKIKQLSQPALSWIDDDFLVNDGGSLRPQYAALRNWALDSSVNARVDFALIPDDNKVAQVLQWEAENFRFLMHPSHDGWYDDPQGSGYVHNINLVKQHLHDCIYFFKKNCINSDCKILVWPGNSDTYDDNVEVVRNLCECGIKATGDGCNYGNTSPIYHLQRINIEPNADRPKSLIKKRIETYLSEGAWVILYTHLYGVTGSGTGETVNSMDNVLDIAAFAHNLCKLRNTEAIWNERRLMYNL